MLPFLSMASGFGPANGVRFGVRRALPRSTQASPGTNRIYVTQCNAMQYNTPADENDQQVRGVVVGD
jgi:hypothetical protein